MNLQHDPSSEKFKCSFCSFELADENAMNQHYKLHENADPMQCVICNTTFKSIAQRNFHTRRHVK